MRVLAVESATESAGVALAGESGVLAAVTVGRGRRHGESIAPAVQFVCACAGVALGELDALAVDVGPGLFTGLRVGVATAKALGFALDLPVVTATSLELLALGAARAGAAGTGHGDGTGDGNATVLVPVVDARRGLLFSARFVVSGGDVERVGDECLCSPDELVAELRGLGGSGSHCLCLGDGARRYAELLAGVPGVALGGPATVHPDAGVLAELGVRRHAAGLAVPVAAVEAHYLRQADVRINWEQRIGPRPVGS